MAFIGPGNVEVVRMEEGTQKYPFVIAVKNDHNHRCLTLPDVVYLSRNPIYLSFQTD